MPARPFPRPLAHHAPPAHPPAIRHADGSPATRNASPPTAPPPASGGIVVNLDDDADFERF